MTDPKPPRSGSLPVLDKLADAVWDHDARIRALEGPKGAPSMADVEAGDMQLRAELGAMKADTDGKMADMARALGRAGESRAWENRVLTFALGVLVIVAVKMPAEQFLPTVTALVALAGGWAHVKGKQRNQDLSGSIPPPKGKQ